MIFPKDKGFKHEAYGAGDVQALLKAQEVRDQKHDEEELEEIITDLNELSVKYGGIGTATTYNEAMENLEETIQEQSGTLVEKSITENGTYNAVDDNADGYSKVTVNVSGSGSTGVKSGAIIRDYDGSVIASYTPAQFAALSAYPAQPVHTGLTGQGYNWSLANAKAYVAKYGYVEVGATYITDDGKTRYYIFIEEDSTGGSVSLGLDGTAVIDWGDGSETDTITGEDIDTQIDTTHIYTTVGKYTITINVTNGNASLMNIQGLKLMKVEIGSGVTSIGDDMCYSCTELTSVTIPDGVTSIGNNVFENCYALTSVTIPDGVTSIGDNVFYYCYALTSVTIPDGVTSIGNSVFYDCYALTSITFEPTTPPTISSGTFDILNPFCTIYVPTGTLEAYTTAENYPDPTIYTYIERPA